MHNAKFAFYNKRSIICGCVIRHYCNRILQKLKLVFKIRMAEKQMLRYTIILSYFVLNPMKYSKLSISAGASYATIVIRYVSNAKSKLVFNTDGRTNRWNAVTFRTQKCSKCSNRVWRYILLICFAAVWFVHTFWQPYVTPLNTNWVVVFYSRMHVWLPFWIGRHMQGSKNQRMPSFCSVDFEVSHLGDQFIMSVLFTASVLIWSRAFIT